MPFEHLIPRPFVPGSIQTYAPMASGVYGISNALKWLYIGQPTTSAAPSSRTSAKMNPRS